MVVFGVGGVCGLLVIFIIQVWDFKVGCEIESGVL